MNRCISQTLEYNGLGRKSQDILKTWYYYDSDGCGIIEDVL